MDVSNPERVRRFLNISESGSNYKRILVEFSNYINHQANELPMQQYRVALLHKVFLHEWRQYLADLHIAFLRRNTVDGDAEGCNKTCESSWHIYHIHHASIKYSVQGCPGEILNWAAKTGE